MLRFLPPHRPLLLPVLGLLVLGAALAAASPLAAAERTVEFSSAPRDARGIDLGLPEPELGIKGTVRFRTNKQDRRALAAAKQQEALHAKAERSRAASTLASTRIEAIEQLLADVEDDEARLRAEIQSRMVERYKGGDAGAIEFLLSGRGISDMVGRGRLLQEQSRRDRRTFDEYELTIARIEQYHQVLEQLRDITGEHAQRLDERAERLDQVLVAARVGHDEAPAAAGRSGKPPKGIDGTWYVMDGAFQAQLFLPNAGSGYTGGTRTAARTATDQQIQRVLADERIDLDASGYQDVLTRQIDGRLLDALSLAADRFGYLRITSLKRDHGTYTSSGNVSAHAYGCAADIGTVGKTYITPGSQVAGGEVQQAVMFFAGLQGDLAPHQVISLFDMGGATLAMGDHGDHIHLGYSC